MDDPRDPDLDDLLNVVDIDIDKTLTITAFDEDGVVSAPITPEQLAAAMADVRRIREDREGM